jgi:hypothetical protein
MEWLPGIMDYCASNLQVLFYFISVSHYKLIVIKAKFTNYHYEYELLSLLSYRKNATTLHCIVGKYKWKSWLYVPVGFKQDPIRLNTIFLEVKFSLCLSELKLNSVAWIREWTIPTERPLLVGEVTDKFCRWWVPYGQHDRSLRPYSQTFRPEPLLFLPTFWPLDHRSSPLCLTKQTLCHEGVWDSGV